MARTKKEILDAAKESDNKVRFTITLSPSLLKEFKDDCDSEGSSYSGVIEELIKDFLYPDETKKKK